MMSIRDRLRVTLVYKDVKKFNSLCAKPTFKDSVELDDDYQAIMLAQISVKMSTPIYLGFAILGKFFISRRWFI